MNRAFKDVIRRCSSLTQLETSPKNFSAFEIRKSFIDYFCKDNQHLYIRSSPVFSLKDPTLAFTNAGMNQFKDVFLGLIEPALNRVTNSQKCIRNNDLNLVGQDSYHHTFFEMLGNWSFGDYFKEEACRMSWDLLTNIYNIPPDRLYITYFKGDEALGLDPDFETREIWLKIGVKESHIIGFGKDENFWTGNVTGPCGPCTEIHYDHIPGRTESGNLVNSGSNEVTELWNLVFTQYDRKSTGELKKLNKHFVDTGMGFERLVAIIQGKPSNYDTDLFSPLFEVIKNHTRHSGYSGKYDGNVMDNNYRKLADHSRMITVAISDGAIPNHQSKLRAIIRKSLTITNKIFGAEPDLLKELTVHVAHTLSDAYPEIERNLHKIHYVIDHEADLIKINKEAAMAQWKKIKASYSTLHDEDVLENPQILSGLEYISKNVLNKGKKSLTGENISVLHETYGMSPHQTEQIALKLGLKFDVISFTDYERFKKTTDKKVINEKYLGARSEYNYLDIIKKLEDKKIQSTCDYFKYDYRIDGSENYSFENQPTTVEAIVYKNDVLDEIVLNDLRDEREEIGLILDRTQLFASEGNQISDCGTLEIENKMVFDIERVIKVKGYVIHFGRFVSFPSDGKLSAHDIGVIKIDKHKRLSTMKNHTALHLLNAALREKVFIGAEKYSEVTPMKFILHYMVYKKEFLSLEDVKSLEKFVKDFIFHGVSVKRKILNHSQFQALNDIVFIPGETILEREISVIEINSGFKLSREYCTGTHVLNTSDLQDFVITKFVKGSFNLYKIEAVTGEKSALIRDSDSKLQKKWTALEKEIPSCESYSPSKVKDFISEVKYFSSEISNNSTEMSFVTRNTLLAAVREALQNLNLLKKSSVWNFLKDEIEKASAVTSEKFIVHCVESCWDFDPKDLTTVASSITDKPLFILFKHKDSVDCQCVVPQVFVSESFSAQKWLVDSVIFIGGVARWGKKEDPNLVCHSSFPKMTEAQLQKLMHHAIGAAKKNIRSLGLP